MSEEEGGGRKKTGVRRQESEEGMAAAYAVRMGKKGVRRQKLEWRRRMRLEGG